MHEIFTTPFMCFAVKVCRCRRVFVLSIHDDSVPYDFWMIVYG